MKKIVVAGYHGYENAGDDATLITIINNIKKVKENAKIVVLSKNPTLTKEKYGVNAIYRFNPVSVMWNIMTSQALILGGGTLIQDSTSSRSIIYYLGLIKLAKLFMKKVMLYSNGMGPIDLPKNKKLASKILNKVDVITLRENYASDFLKDINVTKPEIVISSDPAFNLGYMIKENLGIEILKKENINIDKKIVGVSIRECKNKEKYIKDIAILCDYMIEKYDVNVVFIPFQYSKDMIISNEVMNIMKNKAYVLSEKYDVSEILNVISKCFMIIGMRLHSIIFAGLSNVPTMGIVYDPKVKYYLEILEASNLGTTESIDINNAFKTIDENFKDYDNIKKKMEKKVVELVKNTKENENLLKKIVKK